MPTSTSTITPFIISNNRIKHSDNANILDKLKLLPGQTDISTNVQIQKILKSYIESSQPKYLNWLIDKLFYKGVDAENSKFAAALGILDKLQNLYNDSKIKPSIYSAAIRELSKIIKLEQTDSANIITGNCLNHLTKVSKNPVDVPAMFNTENIRYLKGSKELTGQITLPWLDNTHEQRPLLFKIMEAPTTTLGITLAQCSAEQLLGGNLLTFNAVTELREKKERVEESVEPIINKAKSDMDSLSIETNKQRGELLSEIRRLFQFEKLTTLGTNFLELPTKSDENHINTIAECTKQFKELRQSSVPSTHYTLVNSANEELTNLIRECHDQQKKLLTMSTLQQQITDLGTDLFDCLKDGSDQYYCSLAVENMPDEFFKSESEIYSIASAAQRSNGEFKTLLNLYKDISSMEKNLESHLQVGDNVFQEILKAHNPLLIEAAKHLTNDFEKFGNAVTVERLARDNCENIITEISREQNRIDMIAAAAKNAIQVALLDIMHYQASCSDALASVAKSSLASACAYATYAYSVSCDSNELVPPNFDEIINATKELLVARNQFENNINLEFKILNGTAAVDLVKVHNLENLELEGDLAFIRVDEFVERVKGQWSDIEKHFKLRRDVNTEIILTDTSKNPLDDVIFKLFSTESDITKLIDIQPGGVKFEDITVDNSKLVQLSGVVPKTY
ncbi:hypothetical protein ACNSPD_01035, partial [Yersinia enterocolitica]